MIIVNCREKTLSVDQSLYPCVIGENGTTPFERGREGDGKTPLGVYDIRYGFYRADRLPAPRAPLTFRIIRPDDGWCDAPNDPAYNQPVRLPYPASSEAMHREDGAYDIVIVLGHNDSPPAANLGSAIFLHICQPNHRPTQGCVAVTPDVMIALLPHLYCSQKIQIKA